MAKLIVLCVGLLAAAIINVKAITPEEKAKVEVAMMGHIKECAAKFNIDDADLVKELKNIDGLDPCFFGCIFKDLKLVDEKGLFDPEKAIETSGKYLSDDSDKEAFAKIVKDCASVNDEEVSDAEEGCERSKLLLICLDKHKADFEKSRR